MTVSRHPCVKGSDGFTLIELMIVVAILGILGSVATVSYNHFVAKAQTVEGEIVVYEVDRLQDLYYASNHVYTDSVADLGFAMTGTLKYYTPEVRIGSATDMISYQVRALPVAASATDAWLLTRYRNGAVQVDQVAVSDLVAFATVRYLGNTAAMTSVRATTIAASAAIIDPGSGILVNNEPEWSGDGSSKSCQECGHTVLTQRVVSTRPLK
jgi:prepilin-type N-terminal cleavage/methylation domain-containing protein